MWTGLPLHLALASPCLPVGSSWGGAGVTEGPESSRCNQAFWPHFSHLGNGEGETTRL